MSHISPAFLMNILSPTAKINKRVAFAKSAPESAIPNRSNESNLQPDTNCRIVLFDSLCFVF